MIKNIILEASKKNYIGLRENLNNIIGDKFKDKLSEKLNVFNKNIYKEINQNSSTSIEE